LIWGQVTLVAEIAQARATGTGEFGDAWCKTTHARALMIWSRR
jgi:hypothetical protein